MGPLHPLNLNLQAPLHPVRSRIRALHTAAAVAKIPHISLISAFPNNSEVLLGIGKLLKTEREKCQVLQGVTEWAGSWP